MRALLLSLTLLLSIASARENPFVPSDTKTEVSVAKSAPAVKSTAVSKPKIHPQRRVHEILPAATVHTEKPKIHPQRRTKKKLVINAAKARFIFGEGSLYIETKDSLIRHFMIKKSATLVLDFKSPSDFASLRRDVNVYPVKKMVVGAHGDHYRVVLRLKKALKYSVSKKRYGQLITFK